MELRLDFLLHPSSNLYRRCPSPHLASSSRMLTCSRCYQYAPPVVSLPSSYCPSPAAPANIVDRHLTEDSAQDESAPTLRSLRCFGVNAIKTEVQDSREPIEGPLVPFLGERKDGVHFKRVFVKNAALRVARRNLKFKDVPEAYSCSQQHFHMLPHASTLLDHAIVSLQVV